MRKFWLFKMIFYFIVEGVFLDDILVIEILNYLIVNRVKNL